jgi:hypothetical protein
MRKRTDAYETFKGEARVGKSMSVSIADSQICTWLQQSQSAPCESAPFLV